MKHLIPFTLVLLATINVYADTYLCIAEAASGVEHGGRSGIKANIYDVNNKKYIVSNESSKWEFKEFGHDSSPLVCDSQYYCEIKGGFAAVFIKSKDGVFTFVSNVALDDEFKHLDTQVVKGRCSKL